MCECSRVPTCDERLAMKRLKWPMTMKVHPTFRGLRVDTTDKKMGGRFFSWGEVSGAPNPQAFSLWSAHTETGERLTQDGRYLQLQVSSKYETRLALRAQARWLRRAWRYGELRIIEKCHRESWSGY